MRCVVSCGSTSLPWLVFFFGALLWGSMIHKHTGCISCIWELRETLLSFQTGFILVNAAVVCAILESISGLEPSLVITEPSYLKLVTVSSFCPFILISVLMPLVLFVISLVLYVERHEIHRYLSRFRLFWLLLLECVNLQILLLLCVWKILSTPVQKVN